MTDFVHTLSLLVPSKASQDTVMYCPHRHTFVHVGMLEYWAKVLPKLPRQQLIKTKIEPHG